MVPGDSFPATGNQLVAISLNEIDETDQGKSRVGGSLKIKMADGGTQRSIFIVKRDGRALIFRIIEKLPCRNFGF